MWRRLFEPEETYVLMKKKTTSRSKDLTQRESDLLGNIRAGMTISKSALAAGYSSKWPGQAGSQAFKNIQRKRPEILDQLGMTVEAILQKLKAGENI
jgi:hypothetical protein